MLKTNKPAFKITERQLFFIVMVLNMVPILLFRFFPTMDGAAHLYNSNLINELVFNSNGPISDYFYLNPELVPNWVSHFILASSNLILPAWMAEKILLILYFTLLPISFRALVKVYNKPLLSYIIFPFTYSFLFYIGFYNFCLSFIVLFYAIRYWEINNHKNNLKFWIILGGFITFCYFIHILVYSFLLLAILFLFGQQSISEFFKEKKSKKAIISSLKKDLIVFLVCLPSLIFFVIFFLNRDFSNEGNQYLENSELFKWIKDIRPIIALVYNPELRLTEVLYHLFIGLTAILFYQRIQNIDYENIKPGWSGIKYSIKNGLLLKKDIFLAISLISLLVLFHYPNDGGAGMMSDRFALIFYIFYIIWFAIQVFPRWLNIIAVVLVIGINFGFVYRYLLSTKDLNKMVEPIYKTAKYIEPYSTVIPINYSKHWLSLHFSNYLGTEKPVIILENYEASVGWFPVCWNSKMPNNTIGELTKESTCFHWRNSDNDKKLADYVFIYGTKQDTTECDMKIFNQLEKYYDLIKMDDVDGISLYHKKN